MSAVACCVCAGSICLSDNQERELRNSHKTFYCPMGHAQGFYGESDRDRVSKLRIEVARLERQSGMWRENYHDLRLVAGRCPVPECEWQSNAHASRIRAYLFRHISKVHGLPAPAIKRLEAVS